MAAGERAAGFVRALLAVLSWLPALAYAGEHERTPGASPPAQPLARGIDVSIWDEMERQHVVGVAVGVVRDGRIVHVRGYGFADREKCEPVTDETLFGWASVSKPVTAISALQLWEQGKLDLDADVRRYVPEFLDTGETITVRQLLCHQAGLPHGLLPPRSLLRDWCSEPEHHPAHDVLQAMPVFRDVKLVASPGSQFHYSSAGYVLLSAVVQRAGEGPFIDQVRTRIVEPLGLTSLQPDYAWKRPAHRAAGYRMIHDHIARVRSGDVSWKLGGGGFCANIGDLARFAEGILSYKLVSEATSRRMWTVLRDGRGRSTHYGLGFKIQDDPTGRLIVWHDGAQEKTRSRMVLYPDEGLGIVVLSNCEFAETNRFVHAVEKAMSAIDVSGRD